MDSVALVINGLRPVSLNRLHYRNRKLTQEARIYRAAFLTQLQAYSKDLKALSNTFEPTKHSLSISLFFLIPQSEFFTNKGYISARSQDLDNLFKLVTDCLCNAEYNDPNWLAKKKRTFKEKALYSSINAIQNLDIDDKFVTTMPNEKAPFNGNHTLLITIKILKLPKTIDKISDILNN